MAIRPDFARSALLGLVVGFGLSACGNNDGGAEASISGGNGSLSPGAGGKSASSQSTPSLGADTGAGGSSGSGRSTTADAGGTNGRTTTGEVTSNNGGSLATGTTSGGKSSVGGSEGGAKTNIGGAASGGKTTVGNAAGSSAGGRSTTGGASANNGGTSAAGKSAGGAATGGNVAGGKSSTGGASTGGASTSGTATGGVVAGGKSSTGGASTGGASTGGASTTLDCNAKLPAYTTSTTVSATITISGTKDYGMQRLCADPDTLGKGDQSESQKPVFLLAKGAVLKNVIIGGAGCSAADGVHCESGSCTLENVWIGDVGEDAISFKGNDPNQVMTINGGGAFEASDKVIQHNGPGTIKVNGFFVQNAGKLYRSCGNCSTQYARHIDLTDVFASNVSSTLVGINYNLGDTATIHSLTRCGTVKTVCETFTGNDTGDEPTAKDKYTTSGDGTYCIYTAANILK